MQKLKLKYILRLFFGHFNVYSSIVLDQSPFQWIHMHGLCIMGYQRQ